MDEQDQLMPLVRAAARLRVPDKWLREQALAGRVPCLQVGRRLLVNLGAVRQAIAKMAATSRCDQLQAV